MTVTVETSSRWETTSLLRKLRGHDAYAVQVGHARWLVRSGRGTGAAAEVEVEALILEWALEEGVKPRVLRAVDASDEPVQ